MIETAVGFMIPVVEVIYIDVLDITEGVEVDVAVIIVFPMFIPMTFPFPSTVAIAGFELDHITD